eukprot:scaffold8090_cov82-Cylindrotheca_fusiformis.AAC.12
MTDFIQNTLQAAGPAAVVLFTKSYCPYCQRAKEELFDIGIAPVVVELDKRDDDDGAEIQAALKELTGQSTVPSAWLRGQHIGGSEDVHQGIEDGIFDDIPKSTGEEYADKSGVMPNGTDDGAPYNYITAK